MRWYSLLSVKYIGCEYKHLQNAVVGVYQFVTKVSYRLDGTDLEMPIEISCSDVKPSFSPDQLVVQICFLSENNQSNYSSGEA